MKLNIGTMLKAIYAGVAALGAGVSSALVGAHTFGAIDAGQWVTIGVLALAAFGAVYGVTNAPTNPPGPSA